MPIFIGPHQQQPVFRLIYADVMAATLMVLAMLGYFVHWEVPFCLAALWYVIAIFERYIWR